MPARRPISALASEPPPVGATLAGLRQAQALSLDDLSRRAGVSKSMLSQIERSQANPTVAVVWRLANALGVPIGELLGNGTQPAEATVEVVPVHALPSMRSPDGQCELKILGPIDLAGRFEWYELTIQPGGALVSQAHEPGSREHLSVLTGAMEVIAGTSSSKVKHGETARYAVDQPHTIRNAGRTVASALLTVTHGA